MYSAIPSAFLLTQALKNYGINQVVISPGSRNAPLILSLTADSSFELFSIVDERSAAFFALGRAMASNSAVALLCTSGSALLNYYPAIAEAYYSQIPLLVISADRPLYKIDIGDGQTIKQLDVFASLIGPSFNLKQDVTHNSEAIGRFAPELLLTDQGVVEQNNIEMVANAIDRMREFRIPVHINIPFEEPLYESLLQAPAPFNLPTLSKVQSTKPLPEEVRQVLDSLFNSGLKRVLILVGVWNPSAEELDFLKSIIDKFGALLLTENTSNISPLSSIDSIDSLLAPLEQHPLRESLIERLLPDVVLTLGGLVVSKKIKALLRKKNGLSHFHLGQERALDTYQCLRASIDLKLAADYCRNIDPQIDLTYRDFWTSYYQGLSEKRKAFHLAAPFSDFKAFYQLISKIPDDYAVHFSNSSAIRYAQFFSSKAKIHFCNRGTSGIEGSTSTAVGYASFRGDKTLLVTGDLSFLYDSNALWNTHIPSSFRIIVINNQGGGIFRILPKAQKTPRFDEFLETKHDRKAEALAVHFNFEYSAAHSTVELGTCLENFYQHSSRPKLLEVFTPSDLNEKVLFDYFKSLI